MSCPEHQACGYTAQATEKRAAGPGPMVILHRLGATSTFHTPMEARALAAVILQAVADAERAT